MIAAAREWEGWKKHRETLRAWTILISFIVDRMRNGYETAVRRQNLNTQTSLPQEDNDEENGPETAPSGAPSPHRDDRNAVAKRPSLSNFSNHSTSDVQLKDKE